MNSRWVRWFGATCLGILLAFIGTGPASAADALRLAIPSAERVAAIQAELPELFAQEWKEAQAGGQAAGILADRLEATAQGAQDPVEGYALLREALLWNLAGGRMSQAVGCLLGLGGRYEVKADSLLREAFDRAGKGRVIKLAEFDQLVQAVGSQDLAGLDQATVRALLDGLAAYGRRINAAAGVAALADLRKEIEAKAQQAEALAQAQDALLINPDDPAANLVLARSLLAQGGGEAVLAHLARIAEPRLAAAAKAQLAFDGSKAGAVALLDLWLAAADCRDGDLALAACDWGVRSGQVALADAVGLEKARIEKKMQQFEAKARRRGGEAGVVAPDRRGGTESFSRLMGHIKQTAALKPTILSGIVQKDTKLSGLVVIAPGTQLQGGVKLFPASGAIVVNVPALHVEEAEITGLPYISLSLTRGHFSGPWDQGTIAKSWSNIIAWGRFWTGSGDGYRFRDSVILCASQPYADHGAAQNDRPGQFTRCAFIDPILCRPDILKNTRECLFVRGTLERGRHRVSPVSVEGWFADDVLIESLRDGLYEDANRLRVIKLGGRPPVFAGYDFVSLSTALAAIWLQYGRR